jgi:hypothetical protein
VTTLTSRKKVLAYAAENGWRHGPWSVRRGTRTLWDDFYSDELGRKHIAVCWHRGQIDGATVYVNAAVWERLVHHEQGKATALERWLTSREECVEHRWIPVRGSERRIAPHQVSAQQTLARVPG